MLRFCIVGAGFIGDMHAQALAAISEAKVTVVCSRNQERAAGLAQKADANWVTDYRQAVRRDDVDVVCVCTPSGAHAEVAVAAAAAGKHLVVEKPIDVTLERVDHILEAAQQAGVKLTCIFPLRFTQGTELARVAVAEGRLGRLVLADAYIKWYRDQAYYDSSDWKGTWALDGGGALMNQGIHNIDLLNHLAGSVTSVVARAETLAHTMETEDTAVALLVFANGALGAVETADDIGGGLSRALEARLATVFGGHGGGVVDQDPDVDRQVLHPLDVALREPYRRALRQPDVDKELVAIARG